MTTEFRLFTDYKATGILFILLKIPSIYFKSPFITIIADIKKIELFHSGNTSILQFDKCLT